MNPGFLDLFKLCSPVTLAVGLIALVLPAAAAALRYYMQGDKIRERFSFKELIAIALVFAVIFGVAAFLDLFPKLFARYGDTSMTALTIMLVIFLFCVAMTVVMIVADVSAYGDLSRKIIRLQDEWERQRRIQEKMKRG